MKGRGDSKLQPLLRPRYSAEQVITIRDLLEQEGTFHFPHLGNGLFPAVAALSDADATGYQYVWVRDNVHIACALARLGQTSLARRNLTTLMAWFESQVPRFRAIVEDPDQARDPMARPHVRFDGRGLRDIAQRWPHAQNDALGYFLWGYCLLARQGVVAADGEAFGILAWFPRYFEAIAYWNDEDSGHWEETPHRSAASIGAIVAGLRELRELMALHPNATGAVGLDAAQVERLAQRGQAALTEILPAECIDPRLGNSRPYDAALLFLISPLQVVEWEMAERILADVADHLEGEHGIRRYLGDSYWCADYKEKLPPERRSGDFSDTLAERDTLLTPGSEAQWCLFDPLISIIYGERYRACGDATLLERQTHYLNRALNQLTTADSPFPAYRCPEAYYLQHSRYVPNDDTPLLWTQAHLALALKALLESLSETA